MPALWEAIFKASRITGDDPVADWKTHGRNIAKRVDVLNGKRYAALHFTGPGTDLTVGLADDHMWAGGGGTGSNGIFCNANIPTEECFTTPHKDRVDGFVSASKPLSHQGTLIENIQCRFESGRIVEANATAGQDALRKLIAVDAGASHLGEVALVPHGSPIAQSGLLFWNTLFDENAASHIALGQAYATCIREGEHMDENALAARGANSSLIHVDWMIGSGEVDVDGVRAGWHERAADAQGRVGLDVTATAARLEHTMSTGRLEALSDGVIAVIVTIMVLELHVPRESGWAGFVHVLPLVAIYVLSFLMVGIYWINHHELMRRCEQINYNVLWANLLFFCSALSFMCRLRHGLRRGEALRQLLCPAV